MTPRLYGCGGSGFCRPHGPALLLKIFFRTNSSTEFVPVTSLSSLPILSSPLRGMKSSSMADHHQLAGAHGFRHSAPQATLGYRANKHKHIPLFSRSTEKASVPRKSRDDNKHPQAVRARTSSARNRESDAGHIGNRDVSTSLSCGRHPGHSSSEHTAWRMGAPFLFQRKTKITRITKKTRILNESRSTLSISSSTLYTANGLKSVPRS